MEMTGLYPERDTILELAGVVTDLELNILDESKEYVVHHPQEVFATMDHWNRKHHKKSGLWSRVTNATSNLDEVQKEFLTFLQKHFSKEDQALLAGNSIWQDRRFIIKYMPEVQEYLHYRMIDVSSLKLLATSWFPTLELPKKRDYHRAKEDIVDSINELRFYRENIFISKVSE